jgi:flagellar biosynthesis/type III secretory pathway chaperone
MKLSAELQNQLTELLSAEYASATSLLETVRRENTTLRSNDTEAILAISQEKKQGMRLMWECMQQRDRWLTHHSIETGTAGVVSLVQQNPGTKPADIWEKLSQTASKLQAQNEINGGIVALSQRHNKQALDILCGRTGNSNSTYSSKGEHYKEESGHSIAKA